MGLARLDSSAATSSCREVSSLTRPCRAGEVLGPTLGHPFQSPGLAAGSSMTLDASLTVTRPCSTASRTAGAADCLQTAPWRRESLFSRSPAAARPFPPSKRMVQICTILLSRPSGGRPRRELVGFASMAALFSSRA